MTAVSNRAIEHRPDQPPLLSLAWSASRAQSAAMLKVSNTYPRGESREAASVSDILDRLRKQLSAPEALPEKAVNEFRSLLAGIDADAIEDGVTHPCECVVRDFLRENGAASLLALMHRTDNSRMAAVLRLLGRMRNLDSETRVTLIARGLGSPNIEVRDAAAQAAELWEDPSTLRLLRNHHEPTPWLDAYIKQVANSIAG